MTAKRCNIESIATRRLYGFAPSLSDVSNVWGKLGVDSRLCSLKLSVDSVFFYVFRYRRHKPETYRVC